MNVTAIALAADYKKLQQMLESSEELTPEMIADTLEGIEGALEDKLDNTFKFIRNLEGLSKTCEEEAKRLAERKKSFENQAKNLRQYVLSCLLAAGLDKLKTPVNTFTARKGIASVVIDNVEILPDELVDVQMVSTPDKKAIKEALENGVDVPGAHIEIGSRSLQVR